MTLKQLIEQELDPNVLAAEIANLDKTSKAANNIAQGLQKSPDLQKAITPFQQMVNQQLQQKKMQAQQLQMQQKQQQMQAQQVAQQQKQQVQQQANSPVVKAGTAAGPVPNAASANMQ